VGVHQFTNDGEAQAEAAPRRRGRRRSRLERGIRTAIEALEDVRLLARRDANPAVGDLDHRRVAVGVNANRDVADRVGILDRVVQQVDQHLLECRRIGHDEGPRAALVDVERNRRS
jgi:hypothetical protein